MSQYFDSHNCALQVLIVNYKNQRQILSVAVLGNLRSEIQKSYSHFKIELHSCYVCFCFTLTILFMQTIF